MKGFFVPGQVTITKQERVLKMADGAKENSLL